MKIAEVVRWHFPDATDEEVEYITWEKTGYPVFWNIPKEGDKEAAC